MYAADRSRALVGLENPPVVVKDHAVESELEQRTKTRLALLEGAFGGDSAARATSSLAASRRAGPGAIIRKSTPETALWPPELKKKAAAPPPAVLASPRP